MKKKYLRRVSAGVYASLRGWVYLDLREFMAEYGIPYRQPARLTVTAQVGQSQGEARNGMREKESGRKRVT